MPSIDSIVKYVKYAWETAQKHFGPVQRARFYSWVGSHKGGILATLCFLGLGGYCVHLNRMIDRQHDIVNSFNMAIPQELRGNAEAATRYYDRILSLDPRNSVAMHGKARIAQMLEGAPDKAEKLYERILEVDPTDFKARQNLIALLTPPSETRLHRIEAGIEHSKQMEAQFTAAGEKVPHFVNFIRARAHILRWRANGSLKTDDDDFKEAEALVVKLARDAGPHDKGSAYFDRACMYAMASTAEGITGEQKTKLQAASLEFLKQSKNPQIVRNDMVKEYKEKSDPMNPNFDPHLEGIKDLLGPKPIGAQ